MDFKKIVNPKRLFRRREGSSVEYHNVYLISYYMGLLLIVVAIVDLLLSLFVPVGAKSDVFEVYSRNLSSVVCFALLGAFFVRLGYYGNGLFKRRKDMKWFKFLIVVVAVACFVKAADSFYFTAMRFSVSGSVWLYYLGDAVAWMTIGVFLLIYKRVKLAAKRDTVESHAARKDESDEVFNSVAFDRNEPERHHHHHHHHRSEMPSQTELQPILDKAFSDGVGKGFMDSSINTAKILKNLNVPIEIIMESTGLTAAQIRVL